jgi:hypothetical protein
LGPPTISSSLSAKFFTFKTSMSRGDRKVWDQKEILGYLLQPTQIRQQVGDLLLCQISEQ